MVASAEDGSAEDADHDDMFMLSGDTELEPESEELVEDWEVTRQRMVAAASDQADGPRDLMGACRAGDLARVKFLVEHDEVNVNQKDAFDALPIYFCCLCGHQDVLEYLLHRGTSILVSSKSINSPCFRVHLWPVSSRG